jgi:hypothetical protein
LVFFRKLVLLWQYIPFFSHFDEILHPKQLLIQTDDFFSCWQKDYQIKMQLLSTGL